VVFLTEKGQAPTSRQAALEVLGGVNAGKAAADNDNLLGGGRDVAHAWLAAIPCRQIEQPPVYCKPLVIASPFSLSIE
jgi:hypothetical protein